MAKGHGGKRAGAGAKPGKASARKPPADGKTANFSTRITPETRAAIEAEARDSEESVSQTAEQLILEGLKAKHEARQDNPTHAICYLLGELAEIVAPKQLKTEKFACNWRTDPFLFEAFKLSFVKMMDGLRPVGEAISPVERDPQLKGTTFWGSLESIDARAEHAATILLHNLNAASEPPEKRARLSFGVKRKKFSLRTNLHNAWESLNERTNK